MEYRQDKQSTEFLDLARGLAALWVLLAHCSIWGAGGLWTSMVEPKKAVYLFMAVSGFLMLYTVDRQKIHLHWWKFYIRRYLRIAPAYYFALFVTLIVGRFIVEGMRTFQAFNPAYWANDSVYGAPFQEGGILNLVAHLTFIFGFFPELSVSSLLPDWSLALEMQFYAAFPLLYFAFRRWPAAIVGTTLTIVSITFAYLYGIGVQRGFVRAFDEPTFLLFSLPHFLVGALIYEAGVRNRAINLLGAAVIFVVTAWGTGHSRALLAIALIAIAYFWAFDFPILAKRICHNPVVRFLSDTSYAVYLLHGTVLMIGGARLMNLMIDIGWSKHVAVAMVMLLVTACTYPIAWFVYRFIEMPGIALAKKITASNRPIAPAMT